mgnify:CR=1 FL=1
MVNLTLAIPEDLKREMEKFPEINWSVIAREAIKKRINLLQHLSRFARDSEITEEDAIRLGRKVNEGLAKRYSK